MEKLAKRLQDIINEQDFCFDPKEMSDVEKALRRLAAYEDTGMEPDDIESLKIIPATNELLAYRALGTVEELTRGAALREARDEGRVVVLDATRKPLVWGDDDHNSCLCPDCCEDLMGIPYGEFKILQCPACGQYLDATKIITRAEAEAAIGVAE